VIFGRSEEEPPPESRLGGATTGAATTAAPGDSEPRGPHEGLILLLFVLVTLAASAFVLVKEENHALNDPKAKAERGDINGLDDLSLLREDNFKRVMKEVGDSGMPLVADVRISPGRADVTVQNENGDQKIVTFFPDFSTEKRDFGTSTSDTAPAQAIDAGAPQRMVQGVVEKSGRGAGALDYVTTSFLTERQPTWTIALKEGPARKRLWIADYHGRDVRLSGEPSAQQKRETERNQRETERNQRELRRTQRRIQLRSQCLSRAGDSEDVARCLRRFPP
jgi:hypothetical protein